MTVDCISLVGLMLTILVIGVSIGKFAEKIESFIRRNDVENRHKKDNRR